MFSEKGKVNIGIIAAIVVAQVGILAAIYFFVLKKDDGKKEAVPWEEQYTIYAPEFLKEMQFNPKNTEQFRFMVVTLTLELELKDEELQPEIDLKAGIIRPKIFTELVSHSVEELEDQKSQTAIGEKIKKILNGHLTKGKVHKVIFHEWVKQ